MLYWLRIRILYYRKWFYAISPKLWKLLLPNWYCLFVLLSCTCMSNFKVIDPVVPEIWHRPSSYVLTLPEINYVNISKTNQSNHAIFKLDLYFGDVYLHVQYGVNISKTAACRELTNIQSQRSNSKLKGCVWNTERGGGCQILTLYVHLWLTNCLNMFFRATVGGKQPMGGWSNAISRDYKI